MHCHADNHRELWHTFLASSSLRSRSCTAPAVRAVSCGWSLCRGVWAIFASPPCRFACPVPCNILQVVRWVGQRQGTAGVDPQEGECAAASLLLAAGHLRYYCILLCGDMACRVDRAGHMPHPVAPFNPPGTPEARCCVRYIPDIYVSEVWCQVAWLPIPLLPPPQTHEGCGPLAVSVSSITVVSPGQQSTLPALRKPLLSVDDAAPPTR